MRELLVEFLIAIGKDRVLANLGKIQFLRAHTRRILGQSIGIACL